jgi:hypothetical protein
MEGRSYYPGLDREISPNCNYHSSLIMIIVEGGGSSRAVTRLHTMIGLTGYRARDLMRIRRALYRLTEKA